MRILQASDLPLLVSTLQADGYQVIGPQRVDNAIDYLPLDSVDDLPHGWTEEVGPGHYRLAPNPEQAPFGFALGASPWRRYFFERSRPLTTADRSWSEPPPENDVEDAPKLAFLGIRPCDLQAIEALDRVFLQGAYTDPFYRQVRENLLLLVVNCNEPQTTCFCASLGSGPHAEKGYDLCLTEIGQEFLVEEGSPLGTQVLERLPCRSATFEDFVQRDIRSKAAHHQIGRRLEANELAAQLYGNLDHPHWDEVGQRCLGCGSCTQVCPTCFCFSMEEQSALGDTQGQRMRVPSSCFSENHARIHGANFRSNTTERFRQRILHKFAFWGSQFGNQGCVGCGRCTVWCPAGIDLVEELTALRQGAQPPKAPPIHRRETTWTIDPYRPTPVKVTGVRLETYEVASLRLAAPEGFAARCGQFNMVYLPTVGEVPLSISSFDGKEIEHTIRPVGATTKALTELRSGAQLGIRGPFGSSWPLEAAARREVTVVAGGIGLAPLRGALRTMLDRPELYPSVVLLYGAQSPIDMLYLHEQLGWVNRDNFVLRTTVDWGNPVWRGNVGLVTELMDQRPLDPEGFFFTCGPEVMMRAVVQRLAAAQVPPTHIFLSLERHMKCAAGLCGHCQMGPYFVCKDGPVFRYDQIQHVFGRNGF